MKLTNVLNTNELEIFRHIRSVYNRGEAPHVVLPRNNRHIRASIIYAAVAWLVITKELSLTIIHNDSKYVDKLIATLKDKFELTVTPIKDSDNATRLVYKSQTHVSTNS